MSTNGASTAHLQLNDEYIALPPSTSVLNDQILNAYIRPCNALAYILCHCILLDAMPCKITHQLDPSRFPMCTHIMCRNHIYLYTNKHGTLFTYERLRCLSDLISIQCDVSKSAYLSTILLQQHDAHTLYATNTTPATKLTATQGFSLPLTIRLQDNCNPQLPLF